MDIIDLKKIISVYLKLRKDKKKNKEAIEALEVSLKNILKMVLILVLILSILKRENLLVVLEQYII